MIKDRLKQIFGENKFYLLGIFALFCLFLAILLIFLILFYQEKEKSILTHLGDADFTIEQKTENNSKIELTEIVVDIGGAVKNSGVYQLAEGSRLADLVERAGGFNTKEVDKWWLQKSLNLAEKLVDGKKYYIPYLEETKNTVSSFSIEENLDDLNVNNLISINQASLKTLITLPSVGEVRGQAIIDGRPYSKTEDLLINKIVTETIFEKIKDLIIL